MAKIYPEPKRGKHSESQNVTGDFSRMSLSRARTILHYAPDLADNVLAGGLSLDAEVSPAPGPTLVDDGAT